MKIYTAFRNRNFFLLANLIALTVLQFGIFGRLGLAIYGLLLAYGTVFIMLNVRRDSMRSAGPMFYVAICYFLSYLLSLAINGGIATSGAAMLQFLILTLACYMVDDCSDIQAGVGILSKFLTICGIVLFAGSMAIALTTHNAPAFVKSLPEPIRSELYRFTGSFPVRLTGLIGNANTTAGFCFASSVFSLYIIANGSYGKRWTLISILNIAFCHSMIFLGTACRSFMLASIFSFLSFFILYFHLFPGHGRKNNHVMKVIFFTVCISLLLAAIAFCLSGPFRSFVLNHIIRTSSLETGSGRLAIYRKALELGAGRRLFGFSYGELMETCGVIHAHNNYLEVLSFGGLVSLALYLVYFFYSLFVAIRNTLSSRTIPPSWRLLFCMASCYMIGYMVGGMTECDVDRMKLTSIAMYIILPYIHILDIALQYDKRAINAHNEE